MPYLKMTAVRINLLPVIAAWIILALTRHFYPGLTTGNFVALAFIILLAVLIPGFTRLRTVRVSWFMLVVATLLGVGIILNAWYYTTALGGSPTQPVLINIDCYRWWNDALSHLPASGGEAAYTEFGLYGYVLSAVLYVFGATVGTALLWSMTLTLSSLLMTGSITLRLTGDRKVTLLAMICTAAVCYWLTMGTLILKDSFVILAFLVGTYGLLCKNRKLLVYVSLAAFMLMVSRANAIMMLLIGLGILSFGRRNYIYPAITAGICLILWYLPTAMSEWYAVSDILTSDTRTMIRYDAPNQMALVNIIGDYRIIPFYKKILFLPLTAVVQFFIPFPWNFARDIPFGVTEAYAHVAYPWYAFGAVFIYYLLGQWRKYRTTLYRVAIWASVCWVIPAYLFGGTVSRYGLPFVAIMAPAVALTIYNNRHSKRFYIYMAVFAVIVCAVLIIAHKLQSSAVS